MFDVLDFTYRELDRSIQHLLAEAADIRAQIKRLSEQKQESA